TDMIVNCVGCGDEVHFCDSKPGDPDYEQAYAEAKNLFEVLEELEAMRERGDKSAYSPYWSSYPPAGCLEP
ncbi:MAG TPA: hypothetical protein VN648_15535, partial [Candidatus Methylomirabilis sp.]|nr:hypothetical protein [Candidatus Methylomirabilis sp.]